MQISYQLSSEQIYCKVGSDVELQYPNEAFYTYSRGYLAVVLVIMILGFLSHSVLLCLLGIFMLVFGIAILHLYLIRIGKDWINTLLTCIDTIFVIEEVLRRRKRIMDASTEVRQRRKVTNEQPVPQEPVAGSGTSDVISIDMGKLNDALKKSFKII